jgi:hypothetical protein
MVSPRPRERPIVTTSRRRSGRKKFRKPAQAETVGSIITGTENRNGNSGLHKADGSADDIQLDINNDGTLDSPLGELKKKGN